jgi:transcriptional regulator with XRE-family HTH domain
MTISDKSIILSRGGRVDAALSERIRLFRNALAMNQTEFARAIGSITGIRGDPPRQATVSAWESAEGSAPERGTLRLMADLAEPSYAVLVVAQFERNVENGA